MVKSVITVSMGKQSLTKPTLILLYGYPGSGKTYVGRQLAEHFHAAHIQGDRVRGELFEEPRYDKQENEIVSNLMGYMTEEFLHAGLSVIYDTNAMRVAQRRALRDMARACKATVLLIWIQIDMESAVLRAMKRDKRKADDKYALPIDRTTFQQIATHMQNPTTTEEYLVISGKHTFTTQLHMIQKKLYDLGLLDATSAAQTAIKPGMVNLVPNRMGRVDASRRNIMIR